MTPLMLAKGKVFVGTPVGDVLPGLSADDADALNAWFVAEPRVPNFAARSARSPQPTGDLCRACGGMLVRTGTCSTCQSCGDSSGGCS